MGDEAAISIKTVARKLGWSERTVRRRVKAGAIPVHYSEKRLSFFWSEVLEATRRPPSGKREL